MILCNAPRFGSVGAHCELHKNHPGPHKAVVTWVDFELSPPPAELAPVPAEVVPAPTIYEARSEVVEDTTDAKPRRKRTVL